MPDLPSSAGELSDAGCPPPSGNSGPVEGISASFVTVTKTLVKSGEFPGGTAVAGDKVEDANVVPAGKLGEDAMETLTVAGPDTPGEVELVLPPPPPPHPVSVSARAITAARIPDRRQSCSIIIALLIPDGKCRSLAGMPSLLTMTVCTGSLTSVI
jgi:hypothetical protein